MKTFQKSLINHSSINVWVAFAQYFCRFLFFLIHSWQSYAELFHFARTHGTIFHSHVTILIKRIGRNEYRHQIQPKCGDYIVTFALKNEIDKSVLKKNRKYVCDILFYWQLWFAAWISFTISLFPYLRLSFPWDKNTVALNKWRKQKKSNISYLKIWD